MTSICIRVAVVVIAVALIAPVHVSAQSSTDKLKALLDQIDQSPTLDQYQGFRDRLRDRDPNKRLATFEVMTLSGNPTLQEIALDVALKGDDSVLRTLAVQHLVLAMDAMRIELEPPEEMSKKTQTNWSYFTGAYPLLVKERNLGKRTLVVTDPERQIGGYNVDGIAQISGEVVQITWSGLYSRSFRGEYSDGEFKGTFNFPHYFDQPIVARLIVR